MTHPTPEKIATEELTVRKRPVVVRALRWGGGDTQKVGLFCGLSWGRADVHEVPWNGPDDGEQLVVWNSKEQQWLVVPVGHWIIRGLDGELYPCAPDIFGRTYEPAE